jgi:hypothetical protein
LRELLREFVEHYHVERNHQDLNEALIEPLNEKAGRVIRSTRIGGLLNYEHRAAA